jgi:hypothetical protein
MALDLKGFDCGVSQNAAATRRDGLGCSSFSRNNLRGTVGSIAAPTHLIASTHSRDVGSRILHNSSFLLSSLFKQLIIFNSNYPHINMPSAIIPANSSSSSHDSYYGVLDLAKLGLDKVRSVHPLVNSTVNQLQAVGETYVPAHVIERVSAYSTPVLATVDNRLFAAYDKSLELKSNVHQRVDKVKFTVNNVKQVVVENYNNPAALRSFYASAAEVLASTIQSANANKEQFIVNLKAKMGKAWHDSLVEPAGLFYEKAKLYYSQANGAVLNNSVYATALQAYNTLQAQANNGKVKSAEYLGAIKVQLGSAYDQKLEKPLKDLFVQLKGKAEPVVNQSIQTLLSTSQQVFDKVLPPLAEEKQQSAHPTELTFTSVAGHIQGRLQAEVGIRKEQFNSTVKQPLVLRYQSLSADPHVVQLHQSVSSNIERVKLSLVHLQTVIKEESTERYNSLNSAIHATVPAALQLHLQNLQSTLTQFIQTANQFSNEKTQKAVEKLQEIYNQSKQQLQEKSIAVLGEKNEQLIEQQLISTVSAVNSAVEKLKNLISSSRTIIPEAEAQKQEQEFKKAADTLLQ